MLAGGPPALIPPAPAANHGVGSILDTLERNRSPHEYAEILRICGMPVVQTLTDEELLAVSQMECTAAAFASGFRLTRPQAEGVLAWDAIEGLFAPVGVGFGKCACASVEVVDEIAGRLSVAQTGPLRTPSMAEGSGRIGFSDAQSFESGAKPCVRVTLASGHEIEVSNDHPVFTHRGWVKAADVLPSDLVATARRLPPPASPMSISDDNVKLVAYLLTDGCTRNRAVRFISLPGPLVDEVVSIAGRSGFGARVVRERSRAVRVNISGALGLTRRWGLQGCLSKDKRVPGEFYLLDDRQLALFLNRIWATDGHVNEKGRILEITLASKGMIRDLQVLLTRFGILSRFRHRTIRLKDKQFDAWSLFVTGKPMVERFLSTVGPPLGQQEKCERVYRALRTVRTNTNTDIVPITLGDHAEIAESLGVGRTQVRESLGLTKGQWLGRDTFQRFCWTTGYRGKHAWLATSDLAWQHVKSVEGIGIQPVYDLSVPGTQTWLGNGVVLHNTLLSLMIAQRCWRKGHRRILLLVPAKVMGQLLGDRATAGDVGWARQRVTLTYPVHTLKGDTGRRATILRGVENGEINGLFVVSYELLSQSKKDLLAALEPAAIIADEAHRLKNIKGSARGRRFTRYIQKHKPKFAAMSGTVTGKSILDYWHLIKAALGDHCPLPLTLHAAEEWAPVVDSGAVPSTMQTAVLRPLIDWARLHQMQGTWRRFEVLTNSDGDPPRFSDDLTGFRNSYKARLVSAPGVVSTGEELGVSLVMINSPAPVNLEDEGIKLLVKHIEKINNEMVTPSGDELKHALNRYKWLYELTSGFYNELYWPEPEVLAKKEGIEFGDAEDRLARARLHQAKDNEYGKLLREWLSRHSQPGLDSPMLIGGHMARTGGFSPEPELYDAWRAAKDLEFPGMPERWSRSIRVADYKVSHAVEWCKQQGKHGGIVWWYHQEMGEWMAEALSAVIGKDRVLYSPAGDAKLRDPANSHKFAVASLCSHGEAMNLQHYQRMFYLQWPRPAILAEQSVGRIHRIGQQADELEIIRCDTTEFDVANFAACLTDAVYIHQTTPTRQKLVYATYAPVPKLMPTEWLIEQGFECHRLDATGKRLMAERFGQQV